MDRTRPTRTKIRTRMAAHLIWRSRLSGFLLILVLLVLWEVSARCWVDSTSWPPLTQVFASFGVELAGGELGAAFGSSLVRMFTGFAAGGVAGVAVGLVMASYRWCQALLEPTVELLRPIPIPALVPPLILILGIDDAMKVSVVAFASFFPVVINTFQGTKAVEPTLLAVSRTFGINRPRTLAKVVLPASLPYVFAGLRVSLALALIVTVVAEMIAGSAGIGFYLVSMQYGMRFPEMYAAVVLIAISGYGLNGLLLLLERAVLPWYHQKD